MDGGYIASCHLGEANSQTSHGIAVSFALDDRVILSITSSMAEYPIIFDANAIRSLLAGNKTQTRLLATSPLRECKPGDRLWVKEACAGGRIPDGQSREHFSAIRKAEFVVFVDGWRRHRSGHGHAGSVPTSRKLEWTPAIHMPRWASRATLVIESVRLEPLQSINRRDFVIEGQFATFVGLLWRWRKPIRGLWRDPRRAFAAIWNATHGTSGERWEDNPDIVVLSFRVERQ